MLKGAAMLIRPGGTLLGARLFEPVSINTKSSGDAAHMNSLLAPGTVVTPRVMLRLNNRPEPESGVRLFEEAEICNVLIGPPPDTLPDTVQLLAVSPAAS